LERNLLSQSGFRIREDGLPRAEAPGSSCCPARQAAPPVWRALQALAAGRWAEQRLHLVDSPADAAALFAR